MKLPEENIKTTIGSVSSLITSGSRGWAKYYSNEGALFLRMTNLPRDGIKLLFGNNKYVKLPYNSKEGQRTRVKQDDILISITAELGKIGFVESFIEEAYINQHLCLVRINSSKIDSMYTAYYLASTPQRNLWQRLNDSGAKSGLNLSTISNFPLELPPLSEQKAIANTLSIWDEAIEKTQALISVKEKRFKWLLKTLISDQAGKPGWRKVKLGEIGEISSAGVDKKINENEIVVRLLNYLDVYKKNFLFSNDITHEVTAPEPKVQNCSIKSGDVFFTPSSEVRDDIAQSAVAMEDIPNGVYSYHIIRYRLHENIDLLYRAYAFKSNQFFKQAYMYGDGSGQRYVISQTSFRKIEIYIPPLKNQINIAELIYSSQNEIDKLKEIVEKYKKQKKGLIKKLLTGKWRMNMNRETQ